MDGKWTIYALRDFSFFLLFFVFPSPHFFLLLRGVFYPPSLPLDPLFGLLKICIFCRHDPISRRWLLFLFLLFLGSLFFFVCVFPYLCACVLCVMSCRVGRIYRSHFLSYFTLLHSFNYLPQSLTRSHHLFFCLTNPLMAFTIVLFPPHPVFIVFFLLPSFWLVGWSILSLSLFPLYLPLSRSLCFPFPLFFCANTNNMTNVLVCSLIFCGWARGQVSWSGAFKLQFRICTLSLSIQCMDRQ